MVKLADLLGNVKSRLAVKELTQIISKLSVRELADSQRKKIADVHNCLTLTAGIGILFSRTVHC